ncbi:unnamed protein product [Thlaspi arvense]|uniref:Uncharacterized protein n=1 Tax=Thlaspi arvense TaxID=13288 RepID=A0AAU9RH34_THLAR|nr:unnamed protein product [Thlaspi arvense]
MFEAFCIAILGGCELWFIDSQYTRGRCPRGMDHERFYQNDMIVLAKPDPIDMVQAIQKAISMLPTINPQAMHHRVSQLYSWHDVARRTEIVYDRALRCPNQNLLERLSREGGGGRAVN